MLRDAKAERERLRDALASVQSTVEALVVETERLERLLLDTVRGVAGGAEQGPERVLEAVVTGGGRAVDVADFGG